MSKKQQREPLAAFEALRAFALSLPGGEEGASYGTRCFRVKGKFLCRLREDNETVVIKPVDDARRQALFQIDPHTYFITDHYLGYDCILVRLATVKPEALNQLFESAWRAAAPKKLVAQRHAAG